MPKRERLFPEIQGFILDRRGELERIPQGRRVLLDEFAALIASAASDDGPARLVFICTHNSRRSHMAQLWALVAARHFSVSGIEAFSGGTEATAFNLRAVAALQRAGFAVEVFTDGMNPIYEVRFDEEMDPIRVFSKVVDEPPNPVGDFIAVMTCSSADAACPVVDGAAERVVIPFDDPKAGDGTGREAEIYDERCAEIAREMLYVFSKVARTA